MGKLLKEDLKWCVHRLPARLRDILKDNHNTVLAGGFVRSCIARETVNDIDLFTESKFRAETLAGNIAKAFGSNVIETGNAYTIPLRGPMRAVQVIHRWTFDRAQDVVNSFDFTIARAAIWYDHNLMRFDSECDDRFYPDLAAKRLVYTSPIREEEAGGSMLRLLKFYQRGYRAPLDTVGGLMGRMAARLDIEKIRGWNDTFPGGKAVPDELVFEHNVGRVLTGLLRQVDPGVNDEFLSIAGDEGDESQMTVDAWMR